MRCAGLIAATLLCGAVSALAQNAVLHAIIQDEATGTATPCTVEITDSKGNRALETDSFRGGFRCAGEFTKKLPAGRTHIRISRGFETQFVERELNLEPGNQTNVIFSLKRICNLRKRGWYAGDSHVHMLHGEKTVPVSFYFIALTARAEDLQYLSLAQAWELASPTPEALEAELGKRSQPDCELTWNLEAPKNYYKGDAGRCLGHCWNLGVKGRTTDGLDVVRVLMEASAWDYESKKPTYLNFESHRLIHQQGGAVFYTHPARWWTGTWGGQGDYPRVERMRVSNMAVELPLDTILGPTFDGLDVITGPGEFEANEKSFSIWAMLLNHGYRLAATGSSDACFDRPGGAAPGVPRTYTFVPGGFSLEKVTRATAAGHTFATTGPLIIAMVDGQPPGSLFKNSKRNHELEIEAWACGQDSDGMARLEVLRNGQIFHNFTFSDLPGYIHTNLNFQEQDSGWYCVRVGEGGSKHRRAITGAFYFGPPRAPAPAKAQIHARIIDAQSGASLPGSLTEVEYSGTLFHEAKSHVLKKGEAQLNLPGTVRLRAEAEGYEPETLSPVLDYPPLINAITGLSEADLLEWSTFDRMRQLLSNVQLEFTLKKKAQ